ncbi:MAG: ABC transporter ATP-binding protein [Lachnospiraceae bacterium]|nr:ABC transporter ATP-binding protein [Lachnospiraceae bacterium]
MGKVILKNRFWLGLTVIFKILIGIVFVQVPLTLQKMIDCATDGDYEGFKRWFLFTALFFMLIGVVDYGNRVVQAKYMEKTLTYMKEKVISGIVNKEHRDFFSRNSSEYISSLTNDINLMDKNFIGPLLETIGDVAIIVGSAGALIWINPVIAGMLLVMSVLILMLPKVFGKVLARKQESYSKGLSYYTLRIKDILMGYEVVEAYHLREKVLRDHDSYNKDVQNRNFKAIEAISRVSALSTYLSITTQALSVGIGVWYVFRGMLTLGSLFAISQLNAYLVVPIEGIAQKITLVGSMKEIRKKLQAYIQEGEKTDQRQKKAEFKDKIVFRHVTFSYPEGEDTVLLDFDMTFEKGKKYAVVGASGSGKSTIIRLLLRYYDCDQGEILMDDTQIGEFSKASFYDQIAVIQQNVYMFDDTLKENIVLGRNYRDENLAEALKESGVETFLPLLEDGLDTVLKEDGGRLSGGQKQRVAIARALLEKKPILLLDEATSALDAKTCCEIENTVLEIKDITLISVTHRLTKEILSRFDEVLVMDGGKIVEHGTFDDLLASGGYLYDLYYNASRRESEMTKE